MEKLSNLRVYIITIAGATCWGLIGLFIAPLYARGFTAWDVVAIRGIFTFVILFLLMVVFYRDQLRTRLIDHVFFAGAGIFSIALFNFFYFEVFSQSSLSLAVTLLYTGPLFVTILSRLFFKEPLTIRKGWALVLAVTGCAFVVGLLPFGQGSIPMKTLVMGILSGFCYALYSIFSKPITKRYSALTITTYTFFYTSIFMLLTSDIIRKTDQFQSADVWVAALLLALVATVAGFAFYTSGLKHLEASKASILATIEPIIAVLTGVLFLGEQLGGWQVLGIALVLYSAILVTQGRSKAKKAIDISHPN
ncbi:transporter [Priestia filamentosa]|uniref:Transporter n=1 Tax=Priestia filamentosa TaxID=1402861 RepID=A0A1X7EBY6_9BACI|nr:DMT family transporter [Priestia filamentosa]AKO92752.1 transporter [Priestia filamentosa]MDT3762782.1 DMT family transporter [Priestia filamentosa]OXS69316.1 EamA family transporter [Priestia filamentosa]WCM13881.1 DMT family transporter [Priestia filamentosa]WRU97236.1 DMT family transporter [Priestia filamentosa]